MLKTIAGRLVPAMFATTASRGGTGSAGEGVVQSFVGRVARAAGLSAPERLAELPREYVRQMREVNAGR